MPRTSSARLPAWAAPASHRQARAAILFSDLSRISDSGKGRSGSRGIGKQGGPHGDRVDEKGVIPDFDRIDWKKREVIILFDSNVHSNDKVSGARNALAKELRARGAIVRYADISAELGLNGIDDVIGQLGTDRAVEIVESAYDPKKKKSRVKTDFREQSFAADDWQARLQCGENNEIIHNVSNLVICLTSHPAMCDKLLFDDFRNNIVIAGPAPEDLRSGPLDDVGLIEIRCWIEGNFISRVSREDVRDAALVAARKHCVHPLRDFLNDAASQWDRKQRSERLFQDYFDVEYDLPEEERTRLVPYWAAVSRMFGVSAVARIFEPGCQADHTLVLEGEQGIYKSQALRMFFGAEWFSNQLPPLESKDASIQLAGVWVFELAEFAPLLRSSPAVVKDFLTRQVDRYRPPYMLHSANFPRQCIFTATVNPEEYFTDTTGNRRFWSVKCGPNIRLDLLARDRIQLLGEFVHRYRNKDLWYIPRTEGDLLKLFEAEQKAREITDPWQEPITGWVRDSNCPLQITTAYLLDKLDIPRAQQTKAAQMRVADILRRKLHCKRIIRSSRSWYERTGEVL